MRDLVVEAQNGDREAFAALVHMTNDRMHALAARILRDNVLAEPIHRTATPPLAGPAVSRQDAAARLILRDPELARRRTSFVAGYHPIPAAGGAAGGTTRSGPRDGWLSSAVSTAPRAA